MELRELMNSEFPREALRWKITDQSSVTDSLLNSYIPMFGIILGKYKRLGEVKYIEYFMPGKFLLWGQGNKITYFKYAFRSLATRYTYLKSNLKYDIVKGMIIDAASDKILLTIAFEKGYIPVFSEIDYSKVVVLVSQEFLNPDRKLMLNMVSKEIIGVLSAAGADVIYTADVEKWCFKKPVLDTSFETISDMRNYFSTVTKEVINGFARGQL